VTIWTSPDALEETRRSTQSDGTALLDGWDLSLFRQGHRVLVVENDLMLADDLRRELECLGADVVGPAASVAEALELLRIGPGPDAAILDVFLDDEVVYPVADALRSRSIPFVFGINRLALAIPQAYADVPRVEKPVDMRRLARALERRSAGSDGDLV
jgi:CheY-like chemotaxis protein